jgi:hypothetical protein
LKKRKNKNVMNGWRKNSLAPLIHCLFLCEGNNFTPWQFSTKERTHGTHCNRRLGEPQSQSASASVVLPEDGRLTP